MDFVRAASRVELLFGPEVKAYLDTVYKALNDYDLADQKVKIESADGYEDAVNRKYPAFDKITDFFKTFPKLVRPYALVDQKVP
jgi:hypothetical protein